MHTRPCSLYENLFLFGQSGIYFLINLLQCCCFIFICWVVATFSHFASKITDEYTNFAYFFIIIGFLTYFTVQLFLAVLALKWITVISSVKYFFII